MAAHDTDEHKSSLYIQKWIHNKQLLNDKTRKTVYNWVQQT